MRVRVRREICTRPVLVNGAVVPAMVGRYCWVVRCPLCDGSGTGGGVHFGGRFYSGALACADAHVRTHQRAAR